MVILTINGKKPRIHPSCFIAETAVIIGDVEIGEESSVWFNAVLRGDNNKIKIGKKVNIQDNCVLHVDPLQEMVIGDSVTLGHGVIFHGYKTGNNVLIGMNSTILEEVEIGSWSIVAAGSVVKAKTKIPGGVVVAGVPAKIIKTVDEKLKKLIKGSANYYSSVANKIYKKAASSKIL